MPHGPRKLRKKLRRRVGRLVIELSPEGLRGYGKRKWRRLTWQEVAAIAADPRPLFDLYDGAEFLERIGAQPSEEPSQGIRP